MTLKLVLPYQENLLNEALFAIRTEGYDVIRCSLTGRVYGRVDGNEIQSCLQVLLAQKPFASVDDLVESYALRYTILSTQPAPAFRMIRDARDLMVMMNNESNGQNNMFCFLAGRLFFEHLRRDRDVDSWAVRSMKVQFLADMQDRLGGLGTWHSSLTYEDEDNTISAEAIRLLTTTTNQPISIEDERKNAQRCFEAMLRIDGLHSFRFAAISEKLRKRLLAYCDDSDNQTFENLLSILNKLEEATIEKVAQTRKISEGNSILFFLALDALSAQGRRVMELRKKYEERLAKGTASSSLKGLWNELRNIGIGGSFDDLDSDRLNHLNRWMDRANVELDVISIGAKRKDYLTTFFAKKTENRGNTQVVHGAGTLAHMVEAGIKLKPGHKEMLDAAVKAAKIKKPVKKSDSSANPTATKAKTEKGKRAALIRQNIEELWAKGGLSALDIDLSGLSPAAKPKK